jgi:dipeptide transport system permease protein
MIRLILRQLMFIIISFFGVTIVTYQVINLNISAEPGSMFSSYAAYLNQVFSVNLGTSLVTSEDVLRSFISHLPASLELVLLASVVSLLVGVISGVIAARRHGQTTDFVINNVSIIAYSMPIFWWSILLIVYFALELKWVPVAGRLSFIYDIEPVTGFMLIDTFISDQPYRLEAMRDAVSHLVLPVLTLATLPAAIISRMTRQTMLNTLNEDYMKTAQAKGLSEFRIYWVHGLRNAMIPLSNMLGLQISTLMTGAVVTEYIFAWPGIGKWLLDALAAADYIALSAGILVTATMVILINGIIELIAYWLNPSTRITKRVYYG